MSSLQVPSRNKTSLLRDTNTVIAMEIQIQYFRHFSLLINNFRHFLPLYADFPAKCTIMFDTRNGAVAETAWRDTVGRICGTKGRCDALAQSKKEAQAQLCGPETRVHNNVICPVQEKFLRF